MWRVFLGLGSNVGQRHEFLNKAAQAISKLPETRVVWASSVYETDPYGKLDQGKFLNAAVEIETSLDPPALLREVKSIEKAVGRTAGEKWGPREIDIDVLLYDGYVFNNNTVTVPHPELERRKFVLTALKEIAPDVIHPVNGMTVEEMARTCTDTTRVMVTQFRLKY